MSDEADSNERKQDSPNPKPHETIVGRMIPLTDALFRASSKARGQILNEPGTSDCLPAWCHQIADRFAKTILKPLILLAPKGKFELHSAGRILGLLLRMGVFISNEAKPILQREGLLDLTKEQEEKIEKQAGLELLFPIMSRKLNRPVENEAQFIKESKTEIEKQGEILFEVVGNILVYLLKQPIEEQHKFLVGIPEGFMSFLKSDTSFAGDRGRTNLYMLLLIFWPEIAEMQKTEPAKSRKELLDWLEQKEGGQLVEDEKQFFDLCDDIGLIMKSPGRPSK